MYDFFYSLRVDPPKGSYFFDGFEVMRWPLSEDLRESKHLTLVLVLLVQTPELISCKKMHSCIQQFNFRVLKLIGVSVRYALLSVLLFYYAKHIEYLYRECA